MSSDLREKLSAALKLNRERYGKGHGEGYWQSVVDEVERVLVDTGWYLTRASAVPAEETINYGEDDAGFAGGE
jgi:hypothetical protein